MTSEERKRYQNLQILAYALQLKEWPLERIISREKAYSEVINLEQSLGLGLSPDNPKFLILIQEKIYEILSRPPELPAPNLPPYEILKADYQKYLDNRYQKEVKFTYPGLNEQIEKIQKQFLEKIKQQLIKAKPNLSENPTLLALASQNLTLKIVDRLPQTATKTLLHEVEYQKIIKDFEPEIRQVIKNLGAEKEEIISSSLVQEIPALTYKEAQQIAVIPRESAAIREKLKRIKKEATRSGELPPLPKEIVLKIKEQLGREKLNLNPAFVLFQPKASAALVKKAFYSFRVAALKEAISEINPKYRELINKGLLPEDLQITLETLKEMGLSEKHPVINHLQARIFEFKELEETSPSLFKIIRNYYQYEDLTNQKGVYYPPLNIILPLQKKSLWAEERSYSYYLKSGLDRFRSISNISQRAIKFLTKGKYQSLTGFIKKGVFQKTARWLGKTAFGKSLKLGLKKIGTKLAIKLGIKIGVVAAGAATGPPGWVVVAATVLIELGKKAVSLIQKVFRDPQKAFLAVLAGSLVLVIAPMPFALVGIIPLGIGIGGLVSFVAVPTTMTAISSGVGAFFTSITTLPVTAAVASFIIIIFASLAALTLFIVMVVSGAFILPGTIGVAEQEVISPYESEFFELTKSVSSNKFENDQLPAIVTYTITIKPKGNFVLIRPKLTEEFTVAQKGIPSPVNPCDFGNLPEKISSSETLTCIKTFDSYFKDSAIINTVTLNTEVEGTEGLETGIHKGIANAIIIIGKPPGDCPSGWPANASGARISQGPDGEFSHTGQEAIDIVINNGTAIFATHEGFVQSIGKYGGGGISVSISGKCNGINFSSYYAHLQKILVTIGQFIYKGSLIALSDNTGNSTGPHLHYEFKSVDRKIKMAPPNIPKSVPYGCDYYCGNI